MTCLPSPIRWAIRFREFLIVDTHITTRPSGALDRRNRLCWALGCAPTGRSLRISNTGITTISLASRLPPPSRCRSISRPRQERIRLREHQRRSLQPTCGNRRGPQPSLPPALDRSFTSANGHKVTHAVKGATKTGGMTASKFCERTASLTTATADRKLPTLCFEHLGKRVTLGCGRSCGLLRDALPFLKR